MKIKVDKIMDPKALSNMDPKLRETYERVMGNSVASTQTSPSTSFPSPGAAVSSQFTSNFNTSIAPTPASVPPVAEIPQPQTLTPPFNPPVAPATPVTPFSPPITPQAASAGAFQPLPSPASIPQQQGSSPLLRILYIFGAIVFFALYTIFWIKVFGFQLPF
jgi:hypothetical protein